MSDCQCQKCQWVPPAQSYKEMRDVLKHMQQQSGINPAADEDYERGFREGLRARRRQNYWRGYEDGLKG